jgi:glycosyltransferase involved in cell wall biosynthesis
MNFLYKTPPPNFGKMIEDIYVNNFVIKKPVNQLFYNKIKKSNYFWENDKEPSIWVSMLIPSYNTNKVYLVECVKSIKEQIGDFGIELVWIDDCSSLENSQFLVNLLNMELKPLKNLKLVYQKTKINRGVSFCLHQGVFLCSNEIIFRMDSDDIMLNDRIKKQLDFMNSNSTCVLCGTNIICFNEENGIKNEISRTTHHTLSWEKYKKNPVDWFLNHPTLCFRKSAIMSVGNYKKNFKLPFEDLELELRVLKKYGIVFNLSECLLLYRQHGNQTSIKKNNLNLNTKLKKWLISEMVSR